MKILSWNVNGIRAAERKGLFNWLKKESPDILCLQEIKALSEQVPPHLRNAPGYHIYWNSAERKGYSGVATFTKEQPLEIKKGFGIEGFQGTLKHLFIQKSGGDSVGEKTSCRNNRYSLGNLWGCDCWFHFSPFKKTQL